MKPLVPRSSPNEQSIRRYRRKAASYDSSARFTMPLRERTIALLGLQSGQVVLDVGAGTGLSFELLRRAVGPSGRVLACEQSPEMFAQARARVARAGWHDIWLACTSAETVQLPGAVANILRQTRPGARIAMAGMKFFPWWTGPLNLLAWLKNRPYAVRAAEMHAPWDLVEAQCKWFRVMSTQCGMGYIAHGEVDGG
jgi:SAM-dependent methyltransferase